MLLHMTGEGYQIFLSTYCVQGTGDMNSFKACLGSQWNLPFFYETRNTHTKHDTIRLTIRILLNIN